MFGLAADPVWLVVVADGALEGQRLVEIVVLVAVEVPVRILAPRHAPQFLEVVAAVLLPELVVGLDPGVVEVDDGAAVLLDVPLLGALLALEAGGPALGGDVAQLVAAEAGARVAVVMVVLAQAEGALRLHPLLQAVLGDVPLLAAPEALHQPVLVVLFLQALEVPRSPLPLLLLLRLFLFLLFFLFLPLLLVLLLLLRDGREPVLLLLRDLLDALLEVQVADVLAALLPLDPVGEKEPGVAVLHGMVVVGFLDEQCLLVEEGAVGLVLNSLQLVDVDVVEFSRQLALLRRLGPSLLYLLVLEQHLFGRQLDGLAGYFALLALLLQQLGLLGLYLGLAASHR